jgi:dsRNA-specific ribonuclease
MKMKKELLNLNNIKKVNIILNNKVILNLGLTFYYANISLRLYSTNVKGIDPRIILIINSIKDTENFEIAFTHKSYVKANPNLQSYENLVPYGEKLLDTFLTKFFKAYLS